MSDECNSTNQFSDKIHVAVAVIRDMEGNILVSRRLENAHQGGLWEFPGGKKEEGESIFQTLQRELMEELALTVNSAHPLITIEHDYGDRCVILAVWTVTSFNGEPVSCEGQKFKWVNRQELLSLEMPAADIPIVRAINLPQVYTISPEPNWLLSSCNHIDGAEQKNSAIRRFIAEFESTLQEASLIQLRLKNIARDSWTIIVKECLHLCKNYKSTLMLNSSLEHAIPLGVEGVHLGGAQLQCLHKTGLSVSEIIENILSAQSVKLQSQSKIQDEFVVSASCHDQYQLQMAQELGLDFVVLSPVKSTKSHLSLVPMGWAKFQALSQGCQIPVYALGGLNKKDVVTAQQYGAQGVAGISAFWCVKS